MADITVQDLDEDGVNGLSLAAANAGGDAFLNTKEDVVLLVKNDDASAKQVTITAQSTSKVVGGYGGMTKSDKVKSVGAGEQLLIGPFPRKAFNDSDEKVQISYDAVTSVSVGAFRVNRVRSSA